MSAHLALEHLSSLLDGELPDRERRSARRHLDECADCRVRLAGLRSVAEGLTRLERAPAPRALDLLVTGRHPLRASAPSPLVARAPGALLPLPLVLPLTVVLALAVLLALFGGFEGWAPEPAPSEPAPRAFRLGAAGLERLEPAERWIGTRRFERSSRGWVEIDPSILGEPRLASEAERSALLAEQPELAELLAEAAVEVVAAGQRLRLSGDLQQ